MAPSVRAIALLVCLPVAGATIGSCAGDSQDPDPTPSAAASTVALASPTIASGSATTVTLQAKRSDGANVTTGGLTVTFGLTGTGTSAGTFGPVTDNANGTYSASITGTTAGSPRSLAATLAGATVTTTMPQLTVTPGPFSPAASQVTVSSASVASGSTATLTLTTRDAAGNAITSGGATVVFTLGAGTSQGTLSATTDNGNGTYTATFTATTTGTPRSIGAAFNGSAVTSAAPTITTVPGPVSTAQSVVTTSASSLNVGGAATLTLTTRDAAGNALGTGGLSVVFTRGSGTSDGTIGAVTDHADGTYSATFTATTAGSARTIGATIGGAAVTSTLPAITVATTIGPISPATSVVTVSAATVSSGASATVTLRAKDASGNDLSTGGATVAFALAGSGSSTATIGTVTDHGNGSYSASLTGVAAGTARSIAATINGAAVTTTQPTVTVVPGAISAATSVVSVSSGTIASATTATVTLTAKDAAGNNLSAGGATVVFALGAGTSAGTFSTPADNGNGTYTATFTGTTAGNARTITATINGSAVTSTLPAITVTPGAISAGKSVLTVSASSVAVGATATVTLTARDANDNALTAGGATVAFSTSGGTSAGTLGSVADNANGTYTASFTGTTEGTALSVNATIGESAVTSGSPTVTVYAKGMTLSTSTLLINVAQGQAATPQLVGIFANGGSSVAGLQASVAYTTPGIALCQSSNWLGTPTFDFSTANPVSIITLSATAAALGVYTCTATVTISSTTSGIANKTINVSLAVARSAVAETAVQLVLMGNAGNNTVQTHTPDARVLITNGGRGVVTGLRATVDSAINNGSITSWLTNADLRWEPVVADTVNRPAPSTLVITSRVAPFSASAVIRVTGNGISPIRIPMNVLFNTDPELVTNPRGAVINAFAGGAAIPQALLAFNQNTQITNKRFVSFERDPGRALPSWLAVTLTPLGRGDGTDSAATVTLTANPTGLLADSNYADTVRLKAYIGDSTTTKTFNLPVKLVIERGLVIGEADVALFAVVGTATVTRDVAVTNGGSSTISGLSASVGGAGWLTATFVGGAAAPATLRLTANPTGLPRGTVVNTTVTVSASSPSGVPSRAFPVTLRVY